MVRTLIIICSLGLAHMLSAQTVTSLFPTAHQVNAPVNAELVIAFDRAVDPNTLSERDFRVFGRWSGPASGTLQYEDDQRRIRFVPDEPFFAGEQVSVMLSHHVKFADASGLDHGYVWQFWTRTLAGSFDQTPVDLIQLRQPGEGLIQTYGAYAGDLDNDGYSDLTMINETSDDLRIMMNDGAGNFSDFNIQSMGNGKPSPNEGADFNNDGEIDLAVGDVQGTEVRVMFGDGTGSFTDPVVYEVGQGARGLVTLDANTDGYDDILVASRIDGNLYLLVNNGDATFAVNALSTPANGETALAVADINNDGVMDVFVGAYNSRELLTLLGDGHGNFVEHDRQEVDGQPWMLAAGDLDNDGFVDVATANSSADLSMIAFGDGTGALGVPISLNTTADRFPLAIDLGDVDGDGDLDVVSSNYTSATFTAYENQGARNFTLAQTFSAPDRASCAILHDRDNDGDLDVSATDEGADVLLLFRNDGIVNTTKVFKENSQLTIAPNPIKESIRIEFAVLHPGVYRLELLTLAGELIDVLSSEMRSVGNYQIEWKRPVTLAAGSYLIRFSNADQTTTTQPVLFMD